MEILSDKWQMVIAEAHVASLPPIAVTYGAKLTVDGDQWCFLYGENLQDGVAGFGDTPAIAAMNFETNWLKKRAFVETREGALENPGIEARGGALENSSKITTYKAHDSHGEIDDLTITFSKPPPDFLGNWETEGKKHFRNEAGIIVSAMLKHAPGGLVDAIFVALAEHKAGALVVPHVGNSSGCRGGGEMTL